MKKIIILLFVLILSITFGFAEGAPSSTTQSGTNIQSNNKDTIPTDSTKQKSENEQSGQLNTNHASIEIEKLKTDINNLSDQLNILSLENIPSWSKVLIVANLLLLVLVIILFMLFFTDKSKRRDSIIETITDGESGRIDQWEDTIINRAVNESISRSQSGNSRSTDNELKKVISDLQSRIRIIEDAGRIRAQASTGQPSNQSGISPLPKTQVLKSLYADAIINGAFYRVTEEPNLDTVFELFKKPDSNTMYFKIYPEAYKRILKNPDFIDGCDKQTINQSPQNLEVEEGIVMKDDSGKWRIVHKAKVKFI